MALINMADGRVGARPAFNMPNAKSIVVDIRGTQASPVALTNSYVASTDTLDNADQYVQAKVNVGYVKGSSTSLEVQVSYSDDNSTWYNETVEGAADANGVSIVQPYTYQFTASGNYIIVVNVLSRYFRISVKATGSLTNATCYIGVRLSR